MLVTEIKAVFLSVLILLLVAGCSNSDSNTASSVSRVDLSFSDAAVDEASEVVITVDRIIFRRAENSSEGDIVVDQFSNAPTNSETDADGALTDNNNATINTTSNETYTIDLLTVQGNDSRLVVDNVQLPVGDYSNMIIEVNDEDITGSYVTDSSGVKPLKVPSQALKLGGFTILPTSKQSMVVEFGLQQSMTYNPGPDRYILKPRGVRIVSVDEASLVDGVIDHNALQANDQCKALDLGVTAGNIYLYEGHSLDRSRLADNFDPALQTNATEMIAPIASSSLQSSNYALSYLEPGDYTLAVACHSESDDAETLNSISIPNPTDQLKELTLTEGDWLSCAIPFSEQSCELNNQVVQ